MNFNKYTVTITVLAFLVTLSICCAAPTTRSQKMLTKADIRRKYNHPSIRVDESEIGEVVLDNEESIEEVIQRCKFTLFT